MRKRTVITPNMIAKFRFDEKLRLIILSLMCKTLNADFGDIVEYVADTKNCGLYDENKEFFWKNHVI